MYRNRPGTCIVMYIYLNTKSCMYNDESRILTETVLLLTVLSSTRASVTTIRVVQVAVNLL